MSLDHELQSALRRKEPPAGFTERVLAAIDRHGVAERPSHRGWRAAAAAALLFVIVGGGAAVQVIRAKHQMMSALHITGAKLRDARHHVNEISTR